MIASILILANWRIVAASLAIVAFVVLLFGFIIIVAFLRKVTRPIGKLSLFDVAFLGWVYRRWERLKDRQRLNGGFVIRK